MQKENFHKKFIDMIEMYSDEVKQGFLNYKNAPKTINSILIGESGVGKSSIINTVKCLIEKSSTRFSGGCYSFSVNTKSKEKTKSKSSKDQENKSKDAPDKKVMSCTTCYSRTIIKTHNYGNPIERFKLCFFDTPGGIDQNISVKAAIGKIKEGSEISGSSNSSKNICWLQNRNYQADVIIFVVDVEEVLPNIMCKDIPLFKGKYRKSINDLENLIKKFQGIKNRINNGTESKYEKMWSNPEYILVFTKIDIIEKFKSEKIISDTILNTEKDSKLTIKNMFSCISNRCFFLRNCTKEDKFCILGDNSANKEEYLKFVYAVYDKGYQVWSAKNVKNFECVIL